MSTSTWSINTITPSSHVDINMIHQHVPSTSSLLHLVRITSLFDASANIVSSVYPYFNLQPLRPSTSAFNLHPLQPSSTSISNLHPLQPSTFIHFNLQLQPSSTSTSTFSLLQLRHSTSTFFNLNLHPLRPSTSTSTFLSLRSSTLTFLSRFNLRSLSQLRRTRMVCWLGVSRFRKMRKRLGACGFTPNRAWHHGSGVPFHRVWCGAQTLFAAGLPFSLSCDPSLHVVGVEDRRSL